MANKPTREEAWAILTEHVKNPSLISHALAVEAVMRHFARKKGAAMMEVSLDELIANTIEGMKTIAESIGLKGNPSGTPTT